MTGESGQASGSGAARAPGESFEVTIQEQTGNQVTFRIKSTTKLSKMLDAFADKKGVGKGLACPFRFHHDGQRINPELTAADYSMEPGDTIDASMQQEGGCRLLL